MKGLIAKLWVLLGLSIASTAYAGIFEIVGEGRASRDAEFVSFTVQIKAECYKSSVEVKDAVAAFAIKIRDALKPYANAQLAEQLIILPGYNYREPLVISERNGQKIVCDAAHAWKNSSDITFKLSQVDKLSEFQDAVLGIIDAQSIVLDEKQINQPRIGATLSHPMPALVEEKYKVLDNEALALAYDDAFRQLKIISSKCNIGTAELEKVLPVGMRTPGMERSSGEMSPAPEHPSTPFAFRKITRVVQRLFIFKSAGGPVTCQP